MKNFYEMERIFGEIDAILSISRATKSQSCQNFSAASKVYETSTNQISRSYHEDIPSHKKVKIYRKVNFCCSTVFSLKYRYFTESTTDIDMLLQV